MTEGQDLQVEYISGPEAAPKRIEQREDDFEHVASNVPGSSLKFKRLYQCAVFGGDSFGSSVGKGAYLPRKKRI